MEIVHERRASTRAQQLKLKPGSVTVTVISPLQRNVSIFRLALYETWVYILALVESG